MLRSVRRAAVIVLLAGLFAVSALLVASPAVACDCATASTREYFDRADAVFTARLVDRQEPATVISSIDPALHVFAVDTVYKGTAHESQGVLSPVSGASCGLELTGAGPFVVFATRSADAGAGFPRLAEDQYAAFLCGGSAPWTPELDAELAALAGPPAGPEAVSDPLPGDAGLAPAGSSPLLPVLAGVGAVVVLAGGVALLLRRRLRGRR